MATAPTTWYGKDQYKGAGGPTHATQHGQAVEGVEGLNWYHTGVLGGNTKFGGNDWIQAAPGPYGANPAPAAPPPPGAGTGTPTPASMTTVSTAIQSPTTVGAQPQQGSPSSVAGAFQQALVNRLAPAPLTAQSPEVAPAIAANRAAEQRGVERNRAQLAETAAAQGIDPTALGSLTRGLMADSAMRQGQFEGGALERAAASQQQALSQALGLTGGLLGQQDQMALQRDLAALQAELQGRGLDIQQGLGQGDLSLRRDLGTGQLNLGLLNSLLSNQQFGQGLSGQLALGQAGLNQQALLGMLGVLFG